MMATKNGDDDKDEEVRSHRKEEVPELWNLGEGPGACEERRRKWKRAAIGESGEIRRIKMFQTRRHKGGPGVSSVEGRRKIRWTVPSRQHFKTPERLEFRELGQKNCSNHRPIRSIGLRGLLWS